MAACVLLLVWHTAYALDPTKAITQFSHDIWQDELPQNTVHAIIQTRDGYLWLGTYEGLVRFDGIRFTVFDASTTHDLKGTSVFALYEDRTGALWIATNGGLTVLQHGEFTTYSTQEGLPSNLVLAACEAPDGTMWVGTDRGPVTISSGTVGRPSFTHKLPGESIRAMRFDRGGTLWIGTERGLARYGGGQLTVLGPAQGLPTTLVRSLYQDSRGRIWVGTNAGLARWEDGRFVVMTTRDGLSNDYVPALFEDRDGSMWIGTEDGGLNRLSAGVFSSYQTRDGLSHNFVRSIFEDREGSLWVGTNGGLNRFQDGKFRTYTTQEGLSHDFVRTILEDRDGILWIGTDGGGLNRFHEGRFTVLTTADGLANNSVRAIHQSRDGSLWLGTRGGVSRYTNGSFTTFDTSKGLSQNLVRAIWEDHEGSVWIGTEGGGLNRLRDGTFSVLTTRDGLGSNDIRAVFEDSRGVLWIGTYGGLSKLEKGVLSTYTTRDGLSNDIVFAFHEDAEGTLWIATDSGLNRLQRGKLSSFTTSDGLYDNKVFQILEDQTGHLWMSSNKGIFRASRADLSRRAAGLAGTIESVGFGKADGMKANQCNGSSQPAGCRAADGRLFFPTVRGLVVVDPVRLKTNALAPPVTIERLLVDGSEVEISKPVTIAPGAERFEFDYTALSFLAPGKVRFRYMLEGLDRAWVDAGPRRTAYYTNLPPGRYRLRVIACNNDGVWNQTGASLDLRLLTPWWKTWWAYLLYVTALAAIVTTAVFLRVRSLQRINQTLELMVSERTGELDRKSQELAEKVHQLELSERRAIESEARAIDANRTKSVFLSKMSHELRTPLNSIIGFSGILTERLGGQCSERYLKFMHNIHDSGQHLLSLINDLLDLSKIEAGRMELFIERLSVPRVLDEVRSVMRGVADAKHITITSEVAPSLPELAADPGRLKQILFNLLSNAIKFSPERGVVKVSANPLGRNHPPLHDDGVRIDVIDSGIGIAPEDLEIIFEEFRQAEHVHSHSYEGTGLGLALVKRLVMLHGGAITVQSAVGKGSTFSVYLPLGGPSAGSEPTSGPRAEAHHGSDAAGPRRG